MTTLLLKQTVWYKLEVADVVLKISKEERSNIGPLFQTSPKNPRLGLNLFWIKTDSSFKSLIVTNQRWILKKKLYTCIYYKTYTDSLLGIIGSNITKTFKRNYN